jgi:hypothetical protein
MRLKKFLFEEEIKLKHGDDPDDKFDADQLKMGIEVETEHTNDKSLAKQIAKAHLAEDPKYYTKLKKMEAGG